METGNCRDGPGADGRGRDGPAQKVRCRGDIAEPSPASDQPPRNPELAFSYGSESGADTQTVIPVGQGSGGDLTAGRRSRKGFRGAVHIEYRVSPARQAFFLNLLFGLGPPPLPGAAAGGSVRQPRRPRLPAAGGAAAVERQPEEEALTRG